MSVKAVGPVENGIRGSLISSGTKDETSVGLEVVKSQYYTL